MGFGETVLLGAIAGFTIYLGLPVGRIKGMSEKTRAFLSMTSTGILLFLFFDIFLEISESIEAALDPVNLPGFFTLLFISSYVMSIDSMTHNILLLFITIYRFLFF